MTPEERIADLEQRLAVAEQRATEAEARVGQLYVHLESEQTANAEMRRQVVEAEAARDAARAKLIEDAAEISRLSGEVFGAGFHIETLREALTYACDAIRSGLHPIMPGPTLEAVLRNADKALATTSASDLLKPLKGE